VHKLPESWKSDQGSLKNVDYGEKKHPRVLFFVCWSDTGCGAEDESGDSNRPGEEMFESSESVF
jgi:hypothetical protein